MRCISWPGLAESRVTPHKTHPITSRYGHGPRVVTRQVAHAQLGVAIMGSGERPPRRRWHGGWGKKSHKSVQPNSAKLKAFQQTTNNSYLQFCSSLQYFIRIDSFRTIGAASARMSSSGSRCRPRPSSTAMDVTTEAKRASSNTWWVQQSDNTEPKSSPTLNLCTCVCVGMCLHVRAGVCAWVWGL